MNMSPGFKKTIVIALATSGIVALFVILEIQILKLDKIITNLSQQDISRSVEATSEIKPTKHNTYNIVSGALILQKPDGATEVGVADLKQTGIQNVICGSLEDIYILAQPERVCG